jgi:hypothetical protein
MFHKSQSKFQRFLKNLFGLLIPKCVWECRGYKIFKKKKKRIEGLYNPISIGKYNATKLAVW